MSDPLVFTVGLPDVLLEFFAIQGRYYRLFPFYIRTVENGKIKPEYYRSDSSATYSYRVADNLFISPDYEVYMLDRITKQPLRSKTYKYSDLGYYFMKAIIEKQTGKQLEDFVQENFYRPMGLSTMTYHPKYRFEKNRITPTENETDIRSQLIWGAVHDPGATMQGGVGGHGGLFTNPLDIGTLMFSLILDGEYGGGKNLG